jgi:hypothetical protein
MRFGSGRSSEWKKNLIILARKTVYLVQRYGLPEAHFSSFAGSADFCFLLNDPFTMETTLPRAPDSVENPNVQPLTLTVQIKKYTRSQLVQQKTRKMPKSYR